MPRLGTDPVGLAIEAVDLQHADKSAHTRRQLIGATAVGLGGLAAASFPARVLASPGNDPQTILNVAATAEVLATIVNTHAFRKVDLGDRVTKRNVAAAAYEELIHYQVITQELGGVPVTKKIWIPDAVFANRKNLLSALEVGDQIFVNAYLIGTTVFASASNGDAARYTAEFMAVEAVHRALARQSLGKLGNDRAFAKYSSKETAPGAPNRGQPGFTDIEDAVAQLQDAGFGFGQPGKHPGRFYNFDKVKHQTPHPKDVNTLKLV